MNRAEIEERIKCLNDEMLSNYNIKLQTLKISSDYTYNKAIAVTNNDTTNKGWYGTSYKNCFKTWNDADIFLDGFCLAKNTLLRDDYER